MGEMEDNLQGVRDTDAKKVLKYHIHVYTSVLGMKSSNPSFQIGKAEIPELKNKLESFFEQSVSENNIDLFEILVNPSSLMGANFRQVWNNNGVEDYWEGCISGIVQSREDLKEFRVCYTSTGNSDPFFFQFDEIVVDIIRGDLDILT